MTTRLHVEVKIEAEVAAADQLCQAGHAAYLMHEADAVPVDRQPLHEKMYATDPAAAFSLLLTLALRGVRDIPGVTLREMRVNQPVVTRQASPSDAKD